MATLVTALAVLMQASIAQAQFGGPPGSNGGEGPPGGSNNGGPPDGGQSGFLNFYAHSHELIKAHAIMATLAFGLLFPAGGILIRLGSFRGIWVVHGIFQLLAYILYVSAAGVGIYIAMNLHLLNQTHVIIGIVLLAVLILQPFTGFLHHFSFLRVQKRGLSSYAHIWLGRAIITLGIINGGLGLKLARDTYFFPPTNGEIIAYAVPAAIIWLVYLICAVYGEVKRARQTRNGAAADGVVPRAKAEVDNAEESAPAQYT